MRPWANQHSFIELFDAIAELVGERDCIVDASQRRSWTEVVDRTTRLASGLVAAGVMEHGQVDNVPRWESAHPHVGLLMRNSAEHLEFLLAAYRVRAAPFNINYRYSADELSHLFADAKPSVIVYHREFASVLRGAIDQMPGERPLLVAVDDGTTTDPIDYSLTIADLLSTDPAMLPATRPTDLHVLFTGGTTGYPKGVLWRQGDLIAGPCGHRLKRFDDIVRKAKARDWMRGLAAPPLMHGTALFFALMVWSNGGTVVLSDRGTSFDAAEVLRVCTDERITSMVIVGDAFARPLLKQIRLGSPVPPHLRVLASSGAAFSDRSRAEFGALCPSLRIINALGSSETGPQAVQSEDQEATFLPGPDTVVVSEDKAYVLSTGQPGVGWLASRGPLPQGYLHDRERTENTYVDIEGEVLAVSGDRAVMREDGRVELIGREATTINSGGEKIYTEEVESVLRALPGVDDVVVTGRPSARWGQEVVAVIVLADGEADNDDALRSGAADSLARFKLPKAFIRVDTIQRLPNGKVDYQWAKSVAAHGHV